MRSALFAYLAIQRMASFQVAIIAVKANQPVTSTNHNHNHNHNHNQPATPTKGASQ